MGPKLHFRKISQAENADGMEKLVPVFQKLGKVARSWKLEEEKVSEKGRS